MTWTLRHPGFRLLLCGGSLIVLLGAASCGKKDGGAAAEPAAAPAAAEAPANAPRETEEYKDPKGAFLLTLPKGYTFADKTVGDKVKYIFTYGAVVNLIFTLGPAAPEWDSAAELAKKQDEIRSGKAGFPPGMALLDRGLISFGGMKGFQTVVGGMMAGQEAEMAAYFLVADSNLFTLIVSRKDPAAGVLYGQVRSCITNSFRLPSYKPAAPAAAKPAAAVTAAPPPAVVAPAPAPKAPAPAPAGTNVAAKPAAAPAAKPKPAEPEEPEQPVDPRSEPEWAAARAMLKFTGSMKMGGQQVAMVNDKILRKGDTIAVVFHDKEFVFIVMNISPTGVEYKKQPFQPAE